MPSTIIVPLDGSQLGESVLPWAALLAQTQHSPITLVRAVPIPMMVGDDLGYASPEVYDQIFDADRDAAQTYLSHVGQRLTAEGLVIRTVVRTGMPVDTIHDLADELGADAIVMATHGRGGIARLVLGSNATGVLQQTSVPVMLVHADLDQPAPDPAFRRILVPLDGSALAERGLEFARSIAPPDSTFVLVRVVEPEMRVLPMTVSTLVDDDPATQLAIVNATTYLNAMAVDLQHAGYTVQTHVRPGKPSDEIVTAMLESQVDLVVMTTHGRTGAERWVLGSIADHVVRRADRPVLLVSARTLSARAEGPYKVTDLMTRDLALLRNNEPVAVAARKLLRRRVSGAPVVNADGELIGVISEHDLLTWHANIVKSISGESLDPLEYGYRFEKDTVEQVMSRPAISIDADASLMAAVELLLEHRLRRLPVTRDGKLVGIISRADALRAMTQRDHPSHELLADDPTPALQTI